jgi:hypothetical protein
MKFHVETYWKLRETTQNFVMGAYRSLRGIRVQTFTEFRGILLNSVPFVIRKIWHKKLFLYFWMILKVYQNLFGNIHEIGEIK